MSRKYTPEQLEAEIARPPARPRGRPRKYHTKEEYDEAMSIANHNAYMRRRARATGAPIPAECAKKVSPVCATDDERKAALAEWHHEYYAAHRDELRLAARARQYKKSHD